MANIESSPHPLVFPIPSDAASAPEDDALRLRTRARGLEGMQKEALVDGAAGGHGWRLVCDEGPYLNGTDLAPFPLAYFTAGLINAYLAEIAALAGARGVALPEMELIQDSFYTMEGSAVRGDMRGGALPVALHVRVDTDPGDPLLRNLVMQAIPHSPADALLRTGLAGEFALAHDGRPLAPARAAPWPSPERADLGDALFDAAAPADGVEYDPDIITKLENDTGVFDRDGGPGSSLLSEQKRTLHIRGIARLREDGLSETQVQLYKPMGSNFGFLCDIDEVLEGGTRAPSPLVYLSAGLAFCYLTQIGRYVSIVNAPLSRYAMLQQTAFTAAGSAKHATAEPVRSFVSLEGAADDDAARHIADFAEQTCFLHATCRTPLKTRVRVTDLGEPAEEAAAAAVR